MDDEFHETAARDDAHSTPSPTTSSTDASRQPAAQTLPSIRDTTSRPTDTFSASDTIEEQPPTAASSNKRTHGAGQEVTSS